MSGSALLLSGLSCVLVIVIVVCLILFNATVRNWLNDILIKFDLVSSTEDSNSAEEEVDDDENPSSDSNDITSSSSGSSKNTSDSSKTPTATDSPEDIAAATTIQTNLKGVWNSSLNYYFSSNAKLVIDETNLIWGGEYGYTVDTKSMALVGHISDFTTGYEADFTIKSVDSNNATFTLTETGKLPQTRNLQRLILPADANAPNLTGVWNGKRDGDSSVYKITFNTNGTLDARGISDRVLGVDLHWAYYPGTKMFVVVSGDGTNADNQAANFTFTQIDKNTLFVDQYPPYGTKFTFTRAVSVPDTPAEILCKTNLNNFINSAPNVKALTTDQLANMKPQLSSYCAAGTSILKSTCANKNEAFLQQDYKILCCADGNNPTTCGQNVCFDLNETWQKYKTITANLDYNQIVSNNDSVVGMCKAGISMISNSCSQDNPRGFKPFADLCCNKSMDFSQCTENNLICTQLKAQWMHNKELGIGQGMTRQNQADFFIQFCSDGLKITNECPPDQSVIPRNSPFFMNNCCSDPADINTCSANLDCEKAGVDFSNGLVTVPDWLGNKTLMNANKQDVVNFCNGAKVITKLNCPVSFGTDKMYTDVDVFAYNNLVQNVCCGGSSDLANCTDANVAKNFA